MNPTLNRGVILAEELRHLAARMARGEQQQPVQAMVVAGLLASPDLLLNGNPNDTGIVYLEPAHRSSRRVRMKESATMLRYLRRHVGAVEHSLHPRTRHCRVVTFRGAA
jgi:hypothetical protein